MLNVPASGRYLFLYIILYIDAWYIAEIVRFGDFLFQEFFFFLFLHFPQVLEPCLRPRIRYRLVRRLMR